MPGIIFAVIGLLIGGNAKRAVAPSAHTGEKLAKISTPVNIVGLIQGTILAAVMAIVLINSLTNPAVPVSFIAR